MYTVKNSNIKTGPPGLGPFTTLFVESNTEPHPHPLFPASTPPAVRPRSDLSNPDLHPYPFARVASLSTPVPPARISARPASATHATGHRGFVRDQVRLRGAGGGSESGGRMRGGQGAGRRRGRRRCRRRLRRYGICGWLIVMMKWVR